MLRTKIKNFFKLLFTNILIFLVVAIVFEIGGQTYAYFHPAYKVIPFAPHPLLGWRFIPNTEHIITGNYWFAREFSTKVKINSHGFRDVERTIKKNSDTIRIAILGDSMVAAREVDFEKTAGQLLEKRLNKEFSAMTGKKYEVLNFGVPGYGTDQMLLNWEYYASRYDSDFVFLYVFEKNYFRTISTKWCRRGFFGINDLDKEKCLDIRPVSVIKSSRPEKISPEEKTNFKNDYLYINSRSLQVIKGDIIKLGTNFRNLPLEIFFPKSFKSFVKQQRNYLKEEMNGKRIIKIKPKLFLFNFILNILTNLKNILVTNEIHKNWKQDLRYTSGDKNNFPSWLTTNLVNLRTLLALAEDIINSKSDFAIIDSFQFHSKSIPPTRFASKLLKILSANYHFSYIPVYEKLNKTKQGGASLRWKYDAHLNELGNKIFADSMYDYLKQKFIH